MKTYCCYIVVLLVVFASSFTSTSYADNYSNTVNVFKKSKAVQPFFENAYGYAVFPSIGKAGLGVGGAYGTGKVYRGHIVTGTSSIAKLSIGFQAGGQVFSEMIFFRDQRAYEEFTSGEFAFDAQASAAVITTGAQAQAGTKGASAGAAAGPATGAQTKANYKKGMAVFVHVRGGLMYEASIGGQKFSFKPL